MNRLFPENEDRGRAARRALPLADPEIAPYHRLLVAIRWAQSMMEYPEDRALYGRMAAEREGSVFTAMLRDVLYFEWEPDREFVYYEGGLPYGPVVLRLPQRDVVGAYLVLTTPTGEIIDQGPMRCEAGEWRYHPRVPDDRRLPTAHAYIMAIGPHRANA